MLTPEEQQRRQEALRMARQTGGPHEAVKPGPQQPPALEQITPQAASSGTPPAPVTTVATGSAASTSAAALMERDNAAARPPWNPPGAPPSGDRKNPPVAKIKGDVVDDSTPVHAGYNFVPLSRRVFLPPWAKHVSHDFPLAGALSGQIPIRITAQTPVIPGGARKKNEEGTVVEPFQLTDGTPAIPGSTLKGMIRAVIEIAGFGRMSPVNDHHFAVRDLTQGGEFYKERMTVTRDGTIRARARAGFLHFDDDTKAWKILRADQTRVPCYDYSGSDLTIPKEAALENRIVFKKFSKEIKKDDGTTKIVPAGLALKERWKSLIARVPSISKDNPNVKDIFDLLTLSFYVPGYRPEPSSSAGMPILMRLNRRAIQLLCKLRDEDVKVGMTKGILVLTGRSANRKREFIFHDWDKTEPLEIDQAVMDGFLATVSETSGQGTSNQETSSWGYWYPALKSGRIGKGKDIPGIPVFWIPDIPREDDKGVCEDDPCLTDKDVRVAALGTSQMFKLPYDFSVREMIDHTSKAHRPDPTAPDLAALIFGQVADGAGHGLKSRVSFGTAKRVTTAGDTTPSPALPLASPKASYYPCYVRQRCLDKDRPEDERRTGWLGNYNGRGVMQPPGGIYATYMKGGADGDQPRLRGWKRYPAREKTNDPNPSIKPTDASATTLNLLPEGTVFEGMLRFHNLLPAELGALVWALTWGSDPALRHGLGMGKAYGYGQVTVELLDDGAWVRRNPAHTDDEPPEAQTGKAAKTVIEKTIKDFTTLMETWAASPNGPHPDKDNAWAHSEQIVLLKRVAHPDNISPKGGHTPMILGVETGENNHFQLAKGAKGGRGNVKENLSSYALPEPQPSDGETPAEGDILREP